ncbi:MAG: cobyrinate a,c-diamide synthase [Nitrospirae bacterium]|nr:cobyrinate a,c-diamide synthase [Nitrospirota bacterium]
MQGIVIAGTHSGCGKTTITLGILAALKKKGFSIQAFKAGPDFIDAGLHRLITGRHSRNLDLWMCGESYVKDCFCRNSADADVSVVEGVMGLYDGEFSTARLAGVLGLPIVLVVDAYGMAESAGAIVNGFVQYSSKLFEVVQAEPMLNDFKQLNNVEQFIAGVIFNRVASEKHYQRLKNSVRNVPVFGCLPRDMSFEIPHRHLGLQIVEENPVAEENISRLADAVLKHIDVDMIVELSAKTTVLSFPLAQSCHSGLSRIFLGMDSEQVGMTTKTEGLRTSRNDTHSPVHLSTYSPKIAVAYDKAFCFYYEDNLDLLRDSGAEIVLFSPLSDSKLPDNISAVYIGGGYPELYAKLLSENKSMLKSIFQWADSGKPLYAECGGLMYLSEGIYDFDGEFHKMAGVFSFETKMTKGRALLGYREVLLKEDCILGRRGDKLKGHEFHYSEIKHQDVKVSKCQSVKNSDTLMLGHSDTQIYSIRNNVGETLYDEGYKYKNTLASYVHVHFGSNYGSAGEFMNFIREK